ncbi:MAG: isoprenylcysteine carboxylmethyltransferase family protein [Hyphomicrobiaceae bacterium]|nr:isoprenylcysteine carboxylmethyltransferase family protein [Hyphomicrobiaceae bacterium]
MVETSHEPNVERPSGFPWPPVLLVLTVAAAWVLQNVFPLSWPGVGDMASRIAGLGLGLAGLALMAWAVVTLRRASTTVLPHSGATALVTDGPFRYRRNPIYLADMLILLGLAELTRNIWLVLLTPVFGLLVTWLAILPEERHLEARFGDAYRAYKERTRRLL